MKFFGKQNQIIFPAVALLCVFFYGSCGSSEEAPPAAPAETKFLPLVSSTQDQITYYPGSIEGEVNVDIKAQVSGYIQEVYVKEGTFVHKGQPLFKIKSEVFESQVNNSNAAYKSAVANMLSAKNEVEKIEPLVAGKVVAQAQLITAKANYDAAKAQVDQAKATLKSSVINKDFTLITAPVSGFVGRITSRVGNLVTMSDTNPLTTLSQINNVFVYFSLPEAAYLSLAKQQNGINNTINLELADGSIYALSGKLESASGNINATTGTMTMKAVFSNPNHLLRSGGTGKVIIHQPLENVVAIPKSSVKDIQDQLFVFALKDSNKIGMQPVHSFGGNDSIYFIKDGLKSGDRIALDRIDALYDGEVVKPLIQK